jgi:hypothetical protein
VLVVTHTAERCWRIKSMRLRQLPKEPEPHGSVPAVADLCSPLKVTHASARVSIPHNSGPLTVRSRIVPGLRRLAGPHALPAAGLPHRGLMASGVTNAAREPRIIGAVPWAGVLPDAARL